MAVEGCGMLRPNFFLTSVGFRSPLKRRVVRVDDSCFRFLHRWPANGQAEPKKSPRQILEACSRATATGPLCRKMSANAALDFFADRRVNCHSWRSHLLVSKT